LQEGINQGDVFVLAGLESEPGLELMKLAGYDFSWPYNLKSHQYNAVDLNIIRAFSLSDGERSIFAILSDDPGQAGMLLEMILDTRDILKEYQMHKGWFGAKSLLNSVTCTPGHPLEIIGTGMNEGCSWFVFNGYMDFLAKAELEQWMKDVDLPVVTEAGFAPIYRCRDYEGLQVQDMPTKESWYEYAKAKGGYVFKPVYDNAWDGHKFDGYVAIDGNKEQIDGEEVPFIAETGHLADNLLTSMVLFIDKAKPLSKQTLWEAIMDRKAVAVMENALMMGPARFRNALELLYLDRLFVEEYFGDRLDIQAYMDGYDLKVAIKNLNDRPLQGNIKIKVPGGMGLDGSLPGTINIPPFNEKQISISLQPGEENMDYSNPIAVIFNWDGKEKGTLAMLDLPPVISLNKVLFGSAPDVDFPVSIHNYSTEESFPVDVKVFKMQSGSKPVFSQMQTISCKTGDYIRVPFKLKLKEGSYRVVVNALGTSAEGRLGVEKAEGSCSLVEVDLNGDGIMEYKMENDSVQISLITVGARVIEYFVKSRNDNVLFKLWPEKPIDDRRPFRKWGFYPYGGFEDFLGQASMETHKVYDAEIIKAGGDYVRLIMSADYFGNSFRKIFTLYGNSPLLEVRFELDFINPEANMLGPQPILELGKAHGPEDGFTVITKDGYKEFRMRPHEYYGNAIFPKEGWNAGYDTVEDISFVGAFPVDQPLFLHLWMNHPVNKDSHFYYVEFQPWTPIIQKNTMYFTYYLWGSGGQWQNGVEELRKRNLISVMD